MSQFYTYVFRDPSRSMEPFYVGKGTGDRYKRHFGRKDKHPLTQRLQLLRNENVKVDVEIIKALDETHACLLEECLIEIFGRKDLNLGTLLNLTDGGDGRKTWSEEQRHHHRLKMTGQKRSEETRAKMSASAKLRGATKGMTGRKHSEETKRKIAESRKKVTT